MINRVLLSLIILSASYHAFAQSHEKGNLSIDLGLGLGVYATEVTTEIFDTTFTEEDGTAAFLIPFKLQYGLSEKFSLGLLLQAANYIEDEDSADVSNEDFRGAAIRLIGTYYLINRDKFNLHAELGIGIGILNQEEENSTDDFEAAWRGGNLALGIGMKFFITHNIGFFTNIAYSSYQFDLEELSVNDVDVSDVGDWDAQFSGVEITIGLAAKF